uniref:Uncharacterized protein n=1 Tax=Anopheles atroparvus TaxID=41427 RepID=A0A182JM60_ANOAO
MGVDMGWLLGVHGLGVGRLGDDRLSVGRLGDDRLQSGLVDGVGLGKRSRVVHRWLGVRERLGDGQLWRVLTGERAVAHGRSGRVVSHRCGGVGQMLVFRFDVAGAGASQGGKQNNNLEEGRWQNTAHGREDPEDPVLPGVVGAVVGVADVRHVAGRLVAQRLGSDDGSGVRVHWAAVVQGLVLGDEGLGVGRLLDVRGLGVGRLRDIGRHLAASWSPMGGE